MARGWESKSVEAQQADAREKGSNPKPKLSAEAAAKQRQRETLRLARQRVLDQLAASRNPFHRKLLHDELAALEHKLNLLDA